MIQWLYNLAPTGLKALATCVEMQRMQSAGVHNWGQVNRACLVRVAAPESATQAAADVAHPILDSWEGFHQGVAVEQPHTCHVSEPPLRNTHVVRHIQLHIFARCYT